MKIKEIMSVSGMPGLYRLLATKQSGVVGESLVTGQRKFFSARTYQFSPLESIAIYTHDEAIPLEEVFGKMKANPPADHMDKSQLREYFLEVIPDHDQSRVYVSDIKKIVSWFGFLEENGYLEEEESEAEDATEDDGEAPESADGETADTEEPDDEDEGVTEENGEE